MNRHLAVHEHWTQVGGLAKLDAGVREIFDVLAHHVSGMFCNEAEQMLGPAAIRIIDDDDSGAEPFIGWAAQGESAQIDGGHWAPAVFEDPRYPFGRLRPSFLFQQRYDLDHATGIQRIAVVAQ